MQQDVEEAREEGHSRADGGANCVTLLQWGTLSHGHLQMLKISEWKTLASGKRLQITMERSTMF